MARANVPHVISDDSALGGQLISGSLKFDRVSSSVGTYLKRTPSTNGNRKKFALSVWLKRSSSISSWQRIFAASPGSNDISGFAFRGDGNTDGLRLQMTYSGVNKHWTSTGKYRDSNAWYHIVLSVDLDASSGSRVIFYVNGVRDVGSWITGTEPDSSNQYYFNNSATEHRIGSSTSYPTPFDGYMTQFYWLDGVNAIPTDFGYTDNQTGIWRPKKYTGSFGTNGFYIPMDGSSPVGKDMSGNGNDYIPIRCGTVPIGKATGAFPILNTNSGATVANSGVRPDPLASNLVFATALSEYGIVASDVHHLIKGSGSAKSITVSNAVNSNDNYNSLRSTNFYGRSGSAYFNGSNARCNIPSSSDFDIGTSDFTCEAYVQLNSGAGGRTSSVVFNKSVPSASSNSSFYFGCGSNGASLYLSTTGSSWTTWIEVDRTLNDNTWHHIVWQRRSNQLEIFIDGTKATAYAANQNNTIAQDVFTSTRQCNIGTQDGGGSWLNGYVQDLRFYKGIAKYTEDFVCGAVDSSVVEDSPSGIAIPRTLDSHTGGSVALHTTANVSPDIIVASNSDLFLNGDFTIEFWIYLNSIASDTHNPSIITFPDNSGIGQVYINATYNFYSLWWPSSDIVKTVDNGAQIGKWQHVAITRSSNSCRIFVDGALGGSGYNGSHATATSSQNFGNSYGGFRIGGYTQNTGNIDGHISNLRIIKGTALYTSNFTPPSEPLTNVTGTSLLCFQSPTDVEAFTVDKNASTLNNKNWTRSGTFSWSIGADSNVTSKHRQFDGTIETGSAGAPNGNPGNVRFTFDTPITGITKCRLRTNTHNDAYQYRRTYYNGANGTYSIQTSNNTTAWHDVTSNVGNTLNWVEFGSYGGADSDRGPYGCNGIEINDVLLTDRFRDNDGHGDKSSASHFSPFDNDIVQEGPSQYAVLNDRAHTGVTLSNGGLRNTGGNDIPSNMGVKTGKFYVEVSIDTANSSSDLKHLGVCATGTKAFRARSNNGHIINELDTVTIRSDANGPYTHNGRGGITSWTQVFNDTNIIFTNGDIVGIQLDMDNKFVKFYINGSLRTHYTFVLASTFEKMYFYGRNNGSGKTTWNFGQKPYQYTPPAGFLPLASHNLESSSILRPKRFFDTVLWTGNGGTSQTVTGLEFKPDFVWIKGRSGNAWHRLQNSVTGANKLMYTNSTNQEATNEPNGYVSSFTEDGFVLADPDGNGGGVNSSGDNFVAWCWKAGGDSNTFNVDGVGYATASAAGITEGSISLTGASINTKSGFSIFTYTGNGTSGATIGHGLGAVPSVAIFKSRNLGTLGTAGAHWTVFHKNLTNGMNGGGSSRKVHLSLNQAESSNSHGSVTASTSTTMTLTSGSGNDTDAHVNHTGGNYVCYCWTEIPGFSKFGSYKGNADSNGPFVECGFRPALVIYKRITNSDDWGMHDSARDPYNPVKRFLYPNLNNAEWSAGTQDYFEFYSNGFKLTQSASMTNGNGDSYIFMAWAEQPEVTPFGSQSNAR